MTCLKVRITKILNLDWYPGLAECAMVDALGAEHWFQDKIPVFSSKALTPADIPCDGMIRCLRCNESNGMIQVSTDFPDHVESLTGQHLFFVFPDQLIDDKEVFS